MGMHYSGSSITGDPDAMSHELISLLKIFLFDVSGICA